MKVDYDITKQRQDDLIKAYSQVADKCWSQQQAYRKAILLPAPRYYITPKQALQVISPMVKGDFTHVNKMLPYRKRMYYSLYNQVLEMSEKREFAGKKLYYILRFAVLRPAPEFFVTPRILADTRMGIKRHLIDDDGRTIPTKRTIRNYERLKAKRAKIKARKEMQALKRQQKENSELT